ncbi:MAG: hypothetical protein GY817_08220 [bacterium]|nr:hypothetical protein [bacterium]
MFKKAVLMFFFLTCFLNAFIEDFGSNEYIDYSKYGYFENIGTPDYEYIIRNRKALVDAQGEGIYPNQWSVFSHPRFLAYEREGRLEGSRWSFLHFDNPELVYYKWSVSFQADPGIRQFYLAQAMEKAGYIKHAIKAYYSILIFFPKTVVETYLKIPIYLSDISQDRILYLLRKNPDINWSLDAVNIEIKNKFDKDLTNDIFYINPGKISKGRLPEKNKYLRKGIIKGVVYSPTTVGSDQDVRMEEVDFKNMQLMGVNTCIIDIQFCKKNFLKYMFEKYYIKVIIRLNAEYLDEVEAYKNQEYLLFWLVKNPKIIGKVKAIDEDHLIAFANDDLLDIDSFPEEADILGIDIFRGKIGLGNSFWRDIKLNWKKPFFISSYGAPAYNVTNENAETFQLNFHKNYWEQIQENLDSQFLGAVIFEWKDNWSRLANVAHQDTVAVWTGPILDMFLYKEWMGINTVNNEQRKIFSYYKNIWNKEKIK